ncbi:MAG: hypothetical protein ACI9J3_002914 [Parvicellaceae bacterium]|jgi:hypothetical protein
MIEQDIVRLKATRDNFIKLVDALVPSELDKIPGGFSNNIIWNFGHAIASQQLLCYKLAGSQMRLNSDLVKRYKIGTSPAESTPVSEINLLKELANDSADWMLEDYNGGLLTATPFTEYTTSYNITLKTVEEAIAFSNMHEALHLGYAMAIKKAL